MKNLIILAVLMILPYYQSTEGIIPSKPEIEYFINLEEVVISASVHDRIDDLSMLDSIFRDSIESFIRDCKKQGIDIIVFETYRSSERQNLLKNKGRSKLSGGKSKHQYGLAIDIVPTINGELQWNNKKLWQKIGKISKKYNFEWGGNWVYFKDYPHFEYKTEIL